MLSVLIMCSQCAHWVYGSLSPVYRGVMFILLFNLGEQDFEICPGDQIVQLVLKRMATPEVSEVVDLNDNFLPLPTDSPS